MSTTKQFKETKKPKTWRNKNVYVGMNVVYWSPDGDYLAAVVTHVELDGVTCDLYIFPDEAMMTPQHRTDVPHHPKGKTKALDTAPRHAWTLIGQLPCIQSDQ